MAENQFEKTEAPTPRRLQEARRDGNVARSTDLTAAGVLMAAIVLMHVLGLEIMSKLKAVVQAMLSSSLTGNLTRADDLPNVSAYAGRALIGALAPLVLGITAVGLLITVSQVGLIFTTKPLELDLTKLSPLRGLKNIINPRGGMRLAMSLLKIGIIATVAVMAIHQDLPRILLLAELEALPMFAAACELVYGLALKLAGVLLLLALIDYAFQKWQHTRDLRMSKHEVKEELKRMDGDPQIKQRRSRIARQLALQRVGQAVPQADVIVTNPTHFAVALRYDSKSHAAPKVVAKGADFLAMRIRQIAMVHRVPIVERKELARALYHHVEVGQEIPPQYYNAVAEILAYVYRLSGRKTA